MRRLIRFLLRAALLAALLAAFWYYENDTIQTETFSVVSPDIPEAFSGFRIAVITDLEFEDLIKHGATDGLH